jgi:tetratricopeptide (TPR) repeat protein
LVKKLLLIPITILVLSLGGWTPAEAKTAGKLIKQGNQAFAEQRYSEAYDAYEKAAVVEPESPQIYFNKGAVRYMQGDFLPAVELFEQAAQKSKDLSLEARSDYNIGNSYFRESERQRDSDLQKSLEDLQKSIGFYQQALKLDASLDDAAHNIEVARLTMKQVLDALKKQQEEARQQQEKQQQQEKNLEDLIKRQDALLAKTGELQDQATGRGAGETTDTAKKLAEEQRQLRKETEELAEQLSSDPQQADPTTAEAKEHLSRSTAAQETAADQLQHNKPATAQQAEENAAEELRKARDVLQEKKKQNGQPGQDKGQQGEDKKQQPQEGGQKQGRMADENQRMPDDTSGKAEEQGQQQDAIHAAEDARDIINEEKDNREHRQLSMPGGFRPVDRDW